MLRVVVMYRGILRTWRNTNHHHIRIILIRIELLLTVGQRHANNNCMQIYSKTRSMQVKEKKNKKEQEQLYQLSIDIHPHVLCNNQNSQTISRDIPTSSGFKETTPKRDETQTKRMTCVCCPFFQIRKLLSCLLSASPPISSSPRHDRPCVIRLLTCTYRVSKSAYVYLYCRVYGCTDRSPPVANE